MPETTGKRRRRKEIEEMDLYVDNFDQKIIKKMPFLKFYWIDELEFCYIDTHIFVNSEPWEQIIKLLF